MSDLAMGARISVFLASLAISTAATAQPPAQVGVLTGVVLDHTSRNPLDGVVITIPGTDLRTLSNYDGKFKLAGVPVGVQRLDARRNEYTSYKLWPLRISAGDTARITFSMALAAPNAITVNWNANAEGYRGRDNQTFSFRCPPGGTPGAVPGGRPGAVWGTDIYTDDSSVCAAAIHAGRITFVDGGVVTFEILPGRESYAPTTRNGVTSEAFGAWQGSFSIR